MSGAVAMGRLTASMEPPEADAFIIAVPTPIDADHTADLTYVRDAVEQIAPRLRGGEIVILESTSPPGTSLAMSRVAGGAPAGPADAARRKESRTSTSRTAPNASSRAGS